MATAGGGRETAGTHLDDAVAVARRLSNVQWVHVRPPRPWQTHAPPPAPPPTSVRAGRDTAQPRGPTAVVAVSVPTGGGPKKEGRGVPHRQRHPGGCPRLPPPRGRAPAATAAGGGATRETNKTAGGGASPPEAPPWPHTPDAPATTHTVAAPLCHSGTRAGRGRRRAPARGEGHTQRYWTFRAGRGAPPADDARFLAGGCGGQQTRTGRPQQRAPVGPTPTTTRPSSRNWPTRPAPTVARRCGIGSPLPRIAGRPADATGGGGGAGYNVCAPGGEPRVPAAPSPTKQAGRVNVGRRQPPSPRQPKDRAGAAPLPPPAVVALRALAAQSGAGTSGAGGGGGGVNLDWPVTRHATVVCRRAPDGRGRAAGELCGPNSAGAAAAEREPPDDHRTVPHPAREWGEPWRHEWLTGGPTAAAVGVGGTERAAGGHLGSFNPLGCGASTAVVLSTFSCVFGVWARSGSFGNWCLRTMYRACTCC